MIHEQRLNAILELIECRLKNVDLQIDALNLRMKVMATNMEELMAAVQRNNDVGDSAIVLLRGIARRLRDAGTDAVQLAALTESLNAQADEFAEAIVENTPAETPADPA